MDKQEIFPDGTVIDKWFYDIIAYTSKNSAIFYNERRLIIWLMNKNFYII